MWIFDAALQRLTRDPLLTFRWACDGQRIALQWLVKGLEVACRGSNSAGKTQMAAPCVAMSRGLRELDGEPLPELPVPNVGWVLNQSYKQQVESSQAAYAKWLGSWPYYIAYVQGKGKNYWETVYVATTRCRHDYWGIPGKCQECSECPTCSRITFHCEDSSSSLGGRIDWAHADEPPDQKTWREMRMRKKPGHKFPRVITFTPLEKLRWIWMKEDFKDCLVYASPFIQADRKAITGKPSRGRAEVRWTLYDNQYLSDEDVAAFEEAVLGDPQADARLRGDYVDMSGQCPFDVPILRSKWLPRCRPGDIHKVQVLTETDTNEGRIKTPVWLEYEQWFDWEDEEQYLAVGDPSMGIKPRPDDPPSRRHDPAGLWVVACVNPRLVVRYNGYVAPYGLGRLAALLAKEANRALVDCDNTAGYGSPFYTALNDAKHTNVNRDIDPSKPGQIMKGLGYRISAASRGSMLGFLDQTILDDGLVIPSREAVECFMNVTTDVNDRFASTRGRKGRFDEDLSIACRVAKLLATRKWRARKVHRKDRFTRHKDEARRAAHRPPQPDW